MPARSIVFRTLVAFGVVVVPVAALAVPPTESFPESPETPAASAAPPSASAASEPSASVGTSPTAIAPAPKAAQEAPSPAACVVRPSDSGDVRSSQKAAELVCEALRRRGVSVGPASTMSPAGGPAFSIKLEWRSSGYDLEATYESSVGAVKKVRHVEFIDMSQAPAKAEQLADGLLLDDPDAAERPSSLGVTFDVLIGGGSGAPIDGHGGATFAFGAAALLQVGALDVGLGVTNTGLFDESSTIYGVLAGARFDPNPGLRFELLAEGGVEHVSNIGSSTLPLPSSSSGNDSATLPYLGGRASVSLHLGASHHFLLGWWFGAGSTTARATVNPTVEGCLVLTCGSGVETHTVGGPSYTTGLRIGVNLH